jgi:hypothetical protein
MNANFLTPRFGAASSTALRFMLAVTALALPAVAEANLIVNGSFELNTPYAEPPAANVTYGAVAGWGYLGDSPAGAASVWGLTTPYGSYLSMIGGGASFQAGRFTSEDSFFSLTAGQQYSLSFDSVGQQAYTSAWDVLPWEQFKMNLYYIVQYKGGPLDNQAMAEGGVYPVPFTWTTTNVTFTPTVSGSAAVAVYLQNGGWAGNVANVYTAVDNFSLVAVPEPGALALAGVGVAVAACAARRRRSAPAPSAL